MKILREEFRLDGRGTVKYVRGGFLGISRPVRNDDLSKSVLTCVGPGSFTLVSPGEKDHIYTSDDARGVHREGNRVYALQELL